MRWCRNAERSMARMLLLACFVSGLVVGDAAPAAGIREQAEGVKNQVERKSGKRKTADPDDGSVRGGDPFRAQVEKSLAKFRKAAEVADAAAAKAFDRQLDA